MLRFKSTLLVILYSVNLFSTVLSYSKVSTNGQVSDSEGRSASKVAFTVSPVYVPDNHNPRLKPGEAVDHPSTQKYSTLDHATGSSLDLGNNRNNVQERFHTSPIKTIKNNVRNQNGNSNPTQNKNNTASTDIVYSKPVPPNFVYNPNAFKYPPDPQPTSSKPTKYIIDAYPPVPSNLPDIYSGPSEGDPGLSYSHDEGHESKPPYDDHLSKPIEYDSYYNHQPPSVDYDQHYDHPPTPSEYDHPPTPGDYDHPPKPVGYDHPPPKPSGYDSHYIDHPYSDESYTPALYHHPIIYDHIPEGYHHRPKSTTTTTTTEPPDMDDKRVSKKPYSYYHIGRKLWYVPLYFSIYFIIYIGALILKSVARHKIQYPAGMSAEESRRLEEEMSWTHIASVILRGVEVYRNMFGEDASRSPRTKEI